MPDRDRREVQPGHPGAEAGQAECVGADVTLQVNCAQTAHVTEQGEVEPHHVADQAGVVDEPLQVVLGRGRMGRCPLIPVGSVDIPVVIHAMHPDTVPAQRPPRARSPGSAGTSIARPRGCRRLYKGAFRSKSCRHRSAGRERHGAHRGAGVSIGCRTDRAADVTQLRTSSGQSLCSLGVGVETRRVPVPKSASTATVPQTETIRPNPCRSWQTRSPTVKTSSGGIASRAALKGLAGRRRLCTGGGMYPLSSLESGSADPDTVSRLPGVPPAPAGYSCQPPISSPIAAPKTL